ncbi:MAG: hypothetical protein ACW99Q_15740 [Candidatus Kariarchaeaceae archaeon]|jgi:hypothetical protein
MTEEKIKRGRGRPPKVKDVEEEIVVEEVVQELHPVRHVVRAISQLGLDDPDGVYFSVNSVETTLAGYYAQGYILFDTHYVGNIPEGQSIVIAYILVLE